MSRYVTAVFSDLVRHGEAWTRVPRERMAGLIGEYKQIAESLASSYGSFHTNFTGDGHLFLFDNADAAVQFGLRLIERWRSSFDTLPALASMTPIPMRLGCHFGDDTEIVGGAWVGRGNNVAKRIEDAAQPDTMYVTEGVLDLVDIPLYRFQPVVPSLSLKSDHLERRVLYHILSFNADVLAARPNAEMTASDFFLRAVALIGTDRENSEEEAEHYREALRLRPDYHEAHNNYALLLAQTARPQEAETHFKRALELREELPEAHNNYAILLAQAARPQEAETHFKRALELREELPEAHYNYANLLAQAARPQEAETHFKRALELREEYPNAHNNYATLLAARERWEEAEEHYREALRLRPDDNEAHYNYANLLHKRERWEEAEEHYREAYRLDPNDPDYRSAVERLRHRH